MSEKPRDEHDTLDALELLHDGADARSGRAGTAGAAPTLPVAPAAPRSRPPRTLESGGAPSQPDATNTGVPRFRCLYCGYPLLTVGELRCSECGRSYDEEALEYWFSGDEQQRFEHVVWLAAASLFFRLLMLVGQTLWVGRIGSALALAWACHLAHRGKQGSVGAYYALGGIFAGIVMFLAFSWTPKQALPYHTLDIIGGCVLLLAMLHDPVGGDIGGVTVGRRLTPILLFAAPVFALACLVVDASLGARGTISTALGDYSLFGLVVPYVAAAGVWLFVWRTLGGIRRTLFPKTEL